MRFQEKEMNRTQTPAAYQPFVLKEYRYWTLLLNEKQRYLGRAVAWLARPGDMQRFSSLSQRELLELRQITKEYEGALNRIGWKPDHMNYCMLGNFFHEHAGHGHLHIIPRYAPDNHPRFMKIAFADDRWGKNYTPETPLAVPNNVLLSLVAVIKSELK
jgi:diadenosine tetraphosphate (Ap4A) HIT family hydrolase